MIEKSFKTYEQQIELLKSKGLIIDDENKLKWYLNSYNYQNIINGYNDFFMINNDRKTNKYKPNATSNGIIELFNFDRCISRNILSSIQNIERKILTSTVHIIALKMKQNNDATGKLFNLDKNNLIIKKIFKNNSIFEEIKNSFKNDIDIGKPIFNKYKCFEEIPIWTLYCIYLLVKWFVC